jgi:hypothetical protein
MMEMEGGRDEGYHRGHPKASESPARKWGGGHRGSTVKRRKKTLTFQGPFYKILFRDPIFYENVPNSDHDY